MNRIIESYLRAFSKDNIIDEEETSKQFELFANYCVVYEKFPNNFDFRDITSDSEDAGIDGIAFLVDEELAITLDEIEKIFSRSKRNFSVDIIFIQAKTSESYDLGEILKFNNGVEDFLAKVSTQPHGDFLQSAKKMLNYIIDNVSKVKNGRPNCYMYYVCTSNNDIATEIESARTTAIRRIESTALFDKVEYDYIGFQKLMKLWDKTTNVTSATLDVEQYAPYPRMEGVTEAYVAIVSIKNFIESILVTEEGKMKPHIFEENVRSFLGEDNPVNAQIRNTLSSEHQFDKFAIFNNGITIISPDVRVQSNRIALENYQIVNGCQTSNVLYECRDKDLSNAYITVKIIEAIDSDVISDIVRATNSQSKVDDNQFLAFSPFVRRLEKYFETTQDIEGKEIKLYFERRLGQYKNTNIPKRKVFSITETGRALGSLFLRKPDLASRYPNKFIVEMSKALFNDKNKEQAFYISALVDFKLKAFYQKNKILNKYSIYKWHIMTIFGYLATKTNPPSILNKKEVEKYSNKLGVICCSDEKLLKIVEKIPEILEDIGLKNHRDEVRSASYAKQVLEYCNTRLV